MPNILLVDDHSIVRTGLKLLIHDFLAHSIIDEAQDGDSALIKIKQKNYDLVVMDVNMPNTDSFGTLQTILTFNPSIKVIMFSMNAEEVYAKRYLKMGAMGYIRKDAPNNEIEKAITTVLNNKTYVSPELAQKILYDLHSKNESENPFDKLSTREFEIVQHLAQGDSVAEISKKLNVHTSTVGTHKARIFEKLHCHNVIDLTNLAKAHNVILTS
ncbi:MAG: response regulator transcription factor [Bacteroidota bacterium]|nr:response regulator transcription factor [Bacteroidota bacterium]